MLNAVRVTDARRDIVIQVQFVVVRFVVTVYTRYYRRNVYTTGRADNPDFILFTYNGARVHDSSYNNVVFNDNDPSGLAAAIHTTAQAVCNTIDRQTGIATIGRYIEISIRGGGVSFNTSLPSFFRPVYFEISNDNVEISARYCLLTE